MHGLFVYIHLFGITNNRGSPNSSWVIAITHDGYHPQREQMPPTNRLINILKHPALRNHGEPKGPDGGSPFMAWAVPLPAPHSLHWRGNNASAGHRSSELIYWNKLIF